MLSLNVVAVVYWGGMWRFRNITGNLPASNLSSFTYFRAVFSACAIGATVLLISFSLFLIITFSESFLKTYLFLLYSDFVCNMCTMCMPDALKTGIGVTGG